MKGVVVILGEVAGHEAAARLIDGQLEDLLIASADDRMAQAEALYRGIVGRPVKGVGGVFVDLPGGQSGFLRQTKGLRPGAAILVQVSGPAEPGKAVPLSTRVTFKGSYAILTPEAGGINVSRAIKDDAARGRLTELAEEAMGDASETLGLILRSASEIAPPTELRDQIAALRAVAAPILTDGESGPPELLLEAPGPHALALRDWTLPVPDTLAEGKQSFSEHGIETMIDALLRVQVPLPGGASMLIEPTRALVAVDVNTGPDTSPAAGLKANLAAARELPRQLRLRGLGGQITVDFAPMPKRDRQVLEQTLRAAFRRDGGESSLAGWTPLGNFELQRRRDRAPLADSLGKVPH